MPGCGDGLGAGIGPSVQPQMDKEPVGAVGVGWAFRLQIDRQ